MAMMTVYHGGYEPVKEPEIRKGRNTKILGQDFTVRLLKSRLRDGQDDMIQK